jgi:type IV pilus assembly protein PilM
MSAKMAQLPVRDATCKRINDKYKKTHMALPFFVNGARNKRDQMLAIDLGGRTTKAIHLQRRGKELAVTGFALADAPIFEKSLSVDLLMEHLKSVAQTLGAKTKLVTVAVGVGDALVRLVEMPRIPLEDMRQALKFNTKSYLQQDLPNHIFDCHVMPAGKGADQPRPGMGTPKQRVLVAGAKKQFVDDFVEAIKGAGLVADHIVPALICPRNAFEMAMPDVFSKEIVALVDIGFKSSSICILQEGELILTRVVTIGGNRLTEGLSETMSISYAEAEGIKIGMPHEVQLQLEALVMPLGRELRASIDFFEHQQDRAVSREFVSGSSTRSEFILQALQNELMVECKTWNPTGSLQLALSEQQAAEFPGVAPQLTVALGAAFTAF